MLNWTGSMCYAEVPWPRLMPIFACMGQDIKIKIYILGYSYRAIEYREYISIEYREYMSMATYGRN